jgi:hypothetical protein
MTQDDSCGGHTRNSSGEIRITRCVRSIGVRVSRLSLTSFIRIQANG